MPSGKQILLDELKKMSQRRLDKSDLAKAEDRIRSALCAHCSTSGDTMKQISRVGWINKNGEDGLIKQGLGLADGDILFSDLLEEIISDENIPDRVKKRFPSITSEQYVTGLDMIWYMLTAFEYWEYLSELENGGDIDTQESEKILSKYSEWQKCYEKDPW